MTPIRYQHLRPLILLLLLSLATPLAAAPEPAKAPAEDLTEAAAFRMVVVAPDGKGDQPYDAPFTRQITDYRKAQKVADDFKIRIGIRRYHQDGVGEHNMIAVIVPLNPKGQPDGLESYYIQHRGLQRTVEYKDGLKNGIEREIAGAHNTAYVRSEISWVAGKMHGLRKLFYPDGKVMAQTPFENGIEQGESLSFDETGSVIRRVTVKAGKREGDMTDYWPKSDKVKKVVPYKSGKIEGTVRELYLDGKVKSETPFKSDRQEGIAKSYDGEGKVNRITYWRNGDELTKAEYEKQAK